jgi:hypothetical protein
MQDSRLLLWLVLDPMYTTLCPLHHTRPLERGRCKAFGGVTHSLDCCALYLTCTIPVQIHRQFRKPLIVFSPKNLLRHPKCKSPLTEFDDVPDDQVRAVPLGFYCCLGRGFAAHATRCSFV